MTTSMQRGFLLFISLLFTLVIQNVTFCSEIENESVPVSIGLYEEKEKDYNGNSKRPILYKCCENYETEYETHGRRDRNEDTYCLTEKTETVQGNERNDGWVVPASISASRQPINVKLKTSRPVCEKSNREFIWIHVNDDEDEDTLVNRTSSHFFTPEGYFGFENTHFYPSNSYCVQRVNKTSFLVDLCKSDCDGQLGPLESSLKTNCLRKCCPLGEIVSWDGIEYDCTSTEQSWKPLAYEKVQDGMTTISSDRNWSPHILHLSPKSFECPNSLLRWTWPSETEIFRLLKNGNIVYKLITNDSDKELDWKTVRPNDRLYCYDTLNDEFEEGSNKTLQILFFCGDQYNYSTILFASLYSSALFIAAFFLFLAALVNCLLWRKQQAHVNNWIVQAYIINLFLWDIFLGASHLLKPPDLEEEEIHNKHETFNLCAVIGGTAHYFFLSTFCWISVINLDLWRKFRRHNFYSTRSRNIRKFCFYLAFAIGVPAFIIIVGLVLGHLAQENPRSDYGLKTLQYGKTSCFLEDEAKWPYLYGPITGLLILNICFFTSTIFSLYKISQNCLIATSNMHQKRHKQFKLFTKLFCVMGILWNFEVISYALSTAEKQHHQPEWYWVVVDALNIFQGVAIFFIFIWKPQVKVALLTQYPVLRNFCNAPRNRNSRTSAPTQEMQMSNGSQCLRSQSDRTVVSSQGSSVKPSSSVIHT